MWIVNTYGSTGCHSGVSNSKIQFSQASIHKVRIVFGSPLVSLSLTESKIRHASYTLAWILTCVLVKLVVLARDSNQMQNTLNGIRRHEIQLVCSNKFVPNRNKLLQ